MTQTMIDDRTLKARHRAMWALGDYPAVATEVIAALGPALVEAVAVTAGERLLDVAAGSGNVALPAARVGALVTASDLTPELLTTGALLAAQDGLDVRWEEGDAEALPYDDIAIPPVDPAQSRGSTRSVVSPAVKYTAGAGAAPVQIVNRRCFTSRTGGSSPAARRW